MEKLSKKQQRIYDFIKDYVSRNNLPPTIREICNAAGLASTSTVHAHLATLEKKGYITREKSKNRYMEINEEGFYDKQVKKIPIIGTVTAGMPIFASQNIEGYFPLSEEMYQGSCDDNFILRIKGESMINAGIYNGDFVIVHKQSYADNGDIVIALIEDSATCKRFYKEDGNFRLQPENDKYSPIILKDVMILGKVTGLFRSIK